MYWYEAESNCDRLLEEGAFKYPEHEQNIKLFKLYAEVCRQNQYHKDSCYEWTLVGKYRQVKNKNCGVCCSLTPNHTMTKHLKKNICHRKSIDKYTYLRMGEHYVCPVCIRLFETQS